jgi:hypothetical protein
MSARVVERSVEAPMAPVTMTDGSAIIVPFDVVLTAVRRADDAAKEQARIEDGVEKNAVAAIAAGRCPRCQGRLDIPPRMPEYGRSRVCRGCGAKHLVGRKGGS